MQTDSEKILLQLHRLANDRAINFRHRRIIAEALRIQKQTNEELVQYKALDELFESNERVQRVFAEEMKKSNA